MSDAETSSLLGKNLAQKVHGVGVSITAHLPVAGAVAHMKWTYKGIIEYN